ncbi:MAG: nicotinate phosphoribosyltransferase [Spirochaetales bacterium]|nr:nicotinate phosphoribosyltransferase [Spirochaetales bacterium]
MKSSALLTDFYELTMSQGCFLQEKNPSVVFDMFYRSQPFNGGYAVFCGLHDLIDIIENFRFSAEDIAYLESTGIFKSSFLDFLSSFQFSGDIYAMNEGTVIFPGEPLIRVHSSLIEAQLIESILLNTINFQTLIATKMSHVYHASKYGKVLEFGLRRAQGVDGALSASRAAFIGGAFATSNTLAGKMFGIPVSGTMAHSWVMAFETELESFRVFANIYPDNCSLIIDTYDTLGSGIDNAIIVGKEMKAKGKSIGVRLDSGDLSYLSRKVRDRLNEAGLENTSIIVSNDLNEDIINLLVSDDAPIDVWGVGTHLVTGGNQSSMNGVYKLSAKMHSDGSFIPTLKVSNTLLKTTDPGIKQIYRFYDAQHNALADLITLDDEKVVSGKNYTFLHPFIETDRFVLHAGEYTDIEPLLTLKIKNGKRMIRNPGLKDIQKDVQEELKTLHKSYKRLINPHVYKVSLSPKLKSMKNSLIRKFKFSDDEE